MRKRAVPSAPTHPARLPGARLARTAAGCAVAAAGPYHGGMGISSSSPAAPSTTPPTASTARSATSGSAAARSSPRQPTAPPAGRTFDCAGLVVMPGGVDMHAHIAGPKVNVARKLRPEDRRDTPPVPPHRPAPLRHRSAAPRPRSPPATCTPASATPPSSTPPSRRSVPATPTRSSTTRRSSTRASSSSSATTTTSWTSSPRGEPERLRAFCGWLLHATRGLRR